jgi:hypothetical protein
MDHTEQFGLGDHDVLCRNPQRKVAAARLHNRELWKPALVATGPPADTTFQI